MTERINKDELVRRLAARMQADQPGSTASSKHCMRASKQVKA